MMRNIGRFLALATALASSACNFADPTPSRAPDEGSRPNSARTVTTFDEVMLGIEADVPGFAGYVVDSIGNSVLLVKSTVADQTGRRASLSTELRAAFLRAGVDVPSSAAIRSVRHSFRELYATKRKVEGLLPRGIAVSLDVDESRNAVVVGTFDPSARARVVESLRSLQSDSESVVVEELAPVVEAQAILSTSYRRPLLPGFRVSASGGCTLAPFLRRVVDDNVIGDTLYAAINSHCTTTLNGLDGVVVGQGGSRIGEEISDAPGIPCLSGRTCRYGDIAIVRLDDSVSSQIGRVAIFNSTNGSPSNAPTLQSDQALVCCFGGPFVVGTQVTKSGASSGTTNGTVTKTCVDMVYFREGFGGVFFDPGVTWRCAFEANYFASGGDSGAPVFLVQNGVRRLAGIHFAGPRNSSTSGERWFMVWNYATLDFINLGQEFRWANL